MTPLAEDRLPVPKEARELGAASCTDDLLREARAGLARVDVADLDRMFADGALLVCNEGYGSSLAAHTLQRLGLHRATDLVGGFQAWLRAGDAQGPRRPSAKRVRSRLVGE